MNRKLRVLFLVSFIPCGLAVGVQSAPTRVAQAKPAAKPAAAKPAAAKPAAAKPAQAKYAGTENCRMCHSEVAESWDKSAHARSYDLLVNVGKEKDAECLPCHTTGFGKGGFVDEASTPELKNTACEACHGPGADHMGDAAKIQRVPSGKTCAACHQATDIHSMPEE